ncbi:PfaD family polyunsaturated fatty acid/polyketide biosynthesis protein [Streptomyces sp. NPDC050804]|uniref:PfaD family polyunsaturated fatty acid/polyketide biosynthesis protein n=1 Tax=unclassified Streptomyces TaxID=2593676 RepID=UPI003441A0B3|nr:PfaD family polyunsaturated fatty acid/polyketide biosynthesis protein [Streptomyces sp. NBC_00872]
MSVSAHPGSVVTSAPGFTSEDIATCVRRIREQLHIVADSTGRELGLVVGRWPTGEVVGTLPPLYPEWLGERSFCEAHGVRFPYVAGEMANGIATTRMVTAMARSEMLGFFGAGGLGFPEVERAVRELAIELAGRSNWGVNLIHSPSEPELEYRVARLLLRHSVPCISASAFMGLTPAVVLCSASGLSQDPDGQIVRRTRLFAKVSQPQVAAAFLSPAPPDLLRPLVERGEISAEQAELAARVPVAEDITVESDSGGHTDNRPLGSLLPRILLLRDELTRRFGYPRAVRVGAAGGLGTPGGVAAAFALGAAYVVTGSVNQVATEAGISEEAKAMLADADVADVIMAPAADMFELGVKLQVLRRGTMFGPRAAQLYEAYRGYPSLEELPVRLRAKIERDVLRAPIDEVWSLTRQFWQQRDPAEIARAEADPKHRMALVFRWYLGNSSRWAITGDTARRTDYQIWCGPAMGAFNRWAAGSFLAEPANRSVVQIALNLLEGAAVTTRAHQLRTHGVPVPPSAFAFTPYRLA